MTELGQDDLKVIAASANKIIGDMREAARGRRFLGTLQRDVTVEAATILKLVEPHLDNVVPLRPQEKARD